MTLEVPFTSAYLTHDINDLVGHLCLGRGLAVEAEADMDELEDYVLRWRVKLVWLLNCDRGSLSVIFLFGNAFRQLSPEIVQRLLIGPPYIQCHNLLRNQMAVVNALLHSFLQFVNDHDLFFFLKLQKPVGAHEFKNCCRVRHQEVVERVSFEYQPQPWLLLGLSTWLRLNIFQLTRRRLLDLRSVK